MKPQRSRSAVILIVLAAATGRPAAQSANLNAELLKDWTDQKSMMMAISSVTSPPWTTARPEPPGASSGTGTVPSTTTMNAPATAAPRASTTRPVRGVKATANRHHPSPIQSMFQEPPD